MSKCLAQMPELAAFRADGEALVASFRELRDKRHDLVHGAIWSLAPTDGAYLFAKLDIMDDWHHVREFRLESSEFQVFTKKLGNLLAQATAFAQRLWQIVPTSDSPSAAGKSEAV